MRFVWAGEMYENINFGSKRKNKQKKNNLEDI